MPGYPDFRRQAESDTTTLFIREGGVAQAGLVQSGPYYVGNFDQIALLHTSLADPIILNITWFDDQAATISMGQFTTCINTSLNPAQLHIPNMGRYAVISRRAVAGGAWHQDQFQAWGSNRLGGDYSLPLNPAIQLHNAVALGAGLTSTAEFINLSAGLATVSMTTGAAAGSFRLDFYDQAGGAQQFFRINLLAASVDTRLIVLPPASCRSRLVNTGGVASDMALSVIAQL